MCNLLGGIRRSLTKQITRSTDAQLEHEHDELTTKREGLLNWSLSQDYNKSRLKSKTMKIDVSRFELKGDKKQIETYLAKLC